MLVLDSLMRLGRIYAVVDLALLGKPLGLLRDDVVVPDGFAINVAHASDVGWSAFKDIVVLACF